MGNISRRDLIAAQLAALALGACGGRKPGETPNGQKILLRGNGPDPDSLDPHKARSMEATVVLRDLFEGLTRLDRNAAPIPGCGRISGGRMAIGSLRRTSPPACAGWWIRPPRRNTHRSST
jgi:ABC-type oligopeptide transport system substrate-binding subunit